MQQKYDCSRLFEKKNLEKHLDEMNLEVNTEMGLPLRSAVRLTEYSESLIFALPKTQAAASSMDKGCHMTCHEW